MLARRVIEASRPDDGIPIDSIAIEQTAQPRPRRKTEQRTLEIFRPKR